MGGETSCRRAVKVTTQEPCRVRGRFDRSVLRSVRYRFAIGSRTPYEDGFRRTRWQVSRPASDTVGMAAELVPDIYGAIGFRKASRTISNWWPHRRSGSSPENRVTVAPCELDAGLVLQKPRNDARAASPYQPRAPSEVSRAEDGGGLRDEPRCAWGRRARRCGSL